MSMKSLPQTQKFHMVHSHQPGGTVLQCDDLSSSCEVCLDQGTQGACSTGRFQTVSKMLDIKTGKSVTPHKLAALDSFSESSLSGYPVNDVSATACILCHIHTFACFS